jgi:outer membrane protein OmpA-like peptidoglycan-associated protein
MRKRIIGALILLALGAAGIAAAYYLLPKYKEVKGVEGTDAELPKLTVALDSWIGYSILRSPEMRNYLQRAGRRLVCEDDKADAAKRMERLRDGKIQFAVATIDSFLVAGKDFDFPGALIAVIDESKGGDAILSRGEAVPSLEALRGKPETRVAFTPNSPSHHLLRGAAFHFNLPELIPARGRFRVETTGSEDALKKLLSGEAEVAALWEPDVSKALAAPGIKKLLGTEDTEKLIVDVLLVGRKFAKKNPDMVKLFLSSYFKSLKHYQENPEALRTMVTRQTEAPDQAVGPMLKGVRWVNLTQNCEDWFGISPPGGQSDDGLRRAVESTARILVHSGDLASDPVPDGDVSKLTYSVFLKELFLSEFSRDPQGAGGAGRRPTGNTGPKQFPPLSPEAWDKLKQVGALKVDPVTFQSGASSLDLFAKEVIDGAAQLLLHYPNFRVLVRGHTDTRGDPDENRRLSQERADAVVRYLTVTHGVDPNRIRAVGMGGEAPLPRWPDEPLNAWRYRLPRVEIVLVREEL